MTVGKWIRAAAWAPLAALLCAGLAHAADKPAKQRVVREDIEWLDVWQPDTNSHALPRVLLIGDSITRGYGPGVEQRLKGVAYVSRMATSKSLGDPGLLRQVALVLEEQQFDVIHFNNGLHGHDYTLAEYSAALPQLIATLRHGAPKARLVWASSTDVREKDHLDVVSPETARSVERNAAAAAIVAKHGIPAEDLFALVKDHPEYHVSDGVHFTAEGYAVLATQVAATVKGLLPAR
jgi:lysophospholipase L1-like esterase